MISKRAGWRVLVLVAVLAAGGLRLGSFPAQPPKPDVDRVLQELQSIPVGRFQDFLGKYGLWEVDPEELYMEDILSGLIYLIAQQMGLEAYLTTEPETGIVTVQGEFGAKLWEILGIDPERDGGVLVEHVEFRQTPGVTPECDEDHYLFTINCRQIEVVLVRDYGVPAKGLGWGVRGLLLRQYAEARDVPFILVEEKELAVNRDARWRFYAYWTRRLIKDEDGSLYAWEQWKFVEGNPNPVSHRPLGP